MSEKAWWIGYKEQKRNHRGKDISTERFRSQVKRKLGFICANSNLKATWNGSCVRGTTVLDGGDGKVHGI